MSKIRGRLGNILIGEETIKPGQNMNNMRKTLTKNPADPINFIKIQTKIPQTINFNTYSNNQFDFDAQISKYQNDDIKTLLQMQQKYQQGLKSLSQKNYKSDFNN